MTMPQTMKAVFQDAPNSHLYVKEIPVPQPEQGQVLVKMHASPINPSDLSALQGTYAHKPIYPFIPGIEGSGTVISSGGGIIANMRKGKFVALNADKQGTWAEYVVTSAMNCIPMKGFDKDTASMLIVNPFSAVALLSLIEKHKTNHVISTAAASVLGKMIQHLCRERGIEVLNVVRRNEQVEELKKQGAELVLNSSDEDSEEQFARIIKAFKNPVVVDAVGGNLASNIIKYLPEKSHFYSYARLSEEDFSVNPRDILQREITINGFYLSHYMKSLSLPKVLSVIKDAKKLMKTVAKPVIAETFSFEEAQKAVNQYKGNMSEGKVLLKF